MRKRTRTGGLVALVATALAVGCDGGTPSATTTSATTATTVVEAAPTTTANRQLGPNDRRIVLKVGGERRTALLHAPQGHQRSGRLPLVIAMHMLRGGGDGEVMRNLTGLDAKADRERFLVAYPDGIDGRWYPFSCCGPNKDVSFIRALVDHLRQRWAADPDRVYATGISNGAAMSYRLAAALPGVFAAIAPVSGDAKDQQDSVTWPRTPVSLIAFHGRQDSIFDQMQTGVTAWRRHVGCPAPRVESAGGSVTRATSRCRDGTDVVVYELAEMGHAWPGAAAGDPLDAPDTPISASDLLWEFFERHPRRRG
jgi:polyhydroxybutyrate depolymerase